ncbi:unnamed protein product, partial [Laminaria digitata]
MSNVRIETCPGVCALYVALSGSGIEAQTGLRCEPLEFPEVVVGQCTYDMMICENRGASSARITDVLVESDDGAIEVSGLRLPLSIGPGDADGIPLAFCPQQSGTSVAVVRVATSDGIAPATLVRGTTVQPDECRLSYDRNLNFGIVPSDTALEGEITLRNRGAGECFVAGFVLSTGSAPPFSIDPNLERPIGPGETWTIAVHMAPRRAGLYLAELSFL